MAPTIVIITGPTASGKSGIALLIAQKLGGVIINADSQQLYKQLSILTARPSPEEEARAPHRLYGTLDACESCSAGKWLSFARMEIDWALAQGKLPIVVGGTGLYIKALLQGIADIPDVDPAIRQQAMRDYDQMGKEAFAERLKAADPQFFTRLKVYDKQRLVRAYEVWLATGKPLSWWQAQGATPPYPAGQCKLFQVDIARDKLYENCNGRFLKMLDLGAIDEVKQLLSLKLSAELPAMKSVGVRELAAYIDGAITLEEAVSDAQQATRNYAKRQLTWFRTQLKEAVMITSAEQMESKLAA